MLLVKAKKFRKVTLNGKLQYPDSEPMVYQKNGNITAAQATAKLDQLFPDGYIARTCAVTIESDTHDVFAIIAIETPAGGIIGAVDDLAKLGEILKLV